MRERNWLANLELFVLIADEPCLCIPAWVKRGDCKNDPFTHAALRSLATLWRSLGGVKIYQTSTPPLPDLLPLIDRFSITSDDLRPRFNNTMAHMFTNACSAGGAEYRRASARLTTYDNDVPLLDLDADRVRTFPWLIWATNWSGSPTPGCGLSGSLRYADLHAIKI